jgi:hypothetical protein
MTLAVGAVYPLYMKLDIVGTANRRTAFSEFLFRLDQLFFLTGGWADT